MSLEVKMDITTDVTPLFLMIIITLIALPISAFVLLKYKNETMDSYKRKVVRILMGVLIGSTALMVYEIETAHTFLLKSTMIRIIYVSFLFLIQGAWLWLFGYISTQRNA